MRLANSGNSEIVFTTQRLEEVLPRRKIFKKKKFKKKTFKKKTFRKLHNNYKRMSRRITHKKRSRRNLTFVGGAYVQMDREEGQRPTYYDFDEVALFMSQDPSLSIRYEEPGIYDPNFDPRQLNSSSLDFGDGRLTGDQWKYKEGKEAFSRSSNIWPDNGSEAEFFRQLWRVDRDIIETKSLVPLHDPRPMPSIYGSQGRSVSPVQYPEMRNMFSIYESQGRSVSPVQDHEMLNTVRSNQVNVDSYIAARAKYQQAKSARELLISRYLTHFQGLYEPMMLLLQIENNNRFMTNAIRTKMTELDYWIRTLTNLYDISPEVRDDRIVS